MKDKRFVIGIAASAGWIFLAIWMLVTKKHPTELNAWGDFIAGFSAPLAFLWLVLGYLQQGDELRQSTEQLRLQAEELKHSVEQQSQMVAVAREQMKIETDSRIEERERRREAARPKFVVSRDGSIESGGVKRFAIKVTNVGPTATDVEISFSLGANAIGRNVPSFTQHYEFKTEITYATDSEFLLELSYFDADDTPGKVVFPIRITRSLLEIGRARKIS